jgi:hypothetical protein
MARVGERRIFSELPAAVNAYVGWSIDTLGGSRKASVHRPEQQSDDEHLWTFS